MTRAACWLVIVIGAVACAREEAAEIPEGPIEWSVSASTDVSEVEVGDDVTLTLAITHPPEGHFVPPPETEIEPFSVIEHWREEVSPVETRLHYRVAAYQLPADLEVGALQVSYQGNDGEIAVLETDPVPIRVVTSLTPDVTDIHDIKRQAVLTVSRDWSLLWWLLAALLLAAIAYIIYRKFRKELDSKAAPVWTPPPPRPDVEAEAALARLAERKLIENFRLELFFTELTDIMKRYAGRRFDVPYLERTTDEILSDLRDQPVKGLRDILEAADLVKFAKTMPEQDEARSSFALARALVRATKPAPPRSPSSPSSSNEPMEAPA